MTNLTYNGAVYEIVRWPARKNARSPLYATIIVDGKELTLVEYDRGSWHTLKAEKVIKQGTIFIITNGEYDDYNVFAVCVALCDIDLHDIYVGYFEKYPEQQEKYCFDPNGFVKHLIELDVLASSAYDEWNMEKEGFRYINYE